MNQKTIDMKKIFFTILLAVSVSFTTLAFQPGKDVSSSHIQDGGWRERLRAEQIAFLTSEIGLTPQEAEKFWPIYNQIEREKHKAVDNVWNTFFALQKAIDSKAKETEIEMKLKAYAKALDAQNALEGVQMERYSKVLSKEKIAKLYVAEEKFRRQQIRRLHVPQQAQNKPAQNRK